MSPFFKKRAKKQEQVTTRPESKIIKGNTSKQTTSNLESSIAQLKRVFEKDMDFSIRKFNLFRQTPAALVYLSTLVGKEIINRDVLKPLQEQNAPKEGRQPVIRYIMENVLYYSNVKEVTDFSTVISSLVQGKAILFINGIEQALELDVTEQEKRGIEQPESERVVRGPRDGFIEQLPTNIALLRYRLPIPEFRVEQTEVGTRTRSKVAICYLEDVASPVLLQEVKKRIDAIQIDRVLDAGYIEQFIEDNSKSPFPQVLNTERPDKAIGNILEGRVAILVEGSPFALIAPATFNQFYQTSEDYNDRWLISSAIRFIRLVALLFSLTFSSFYITVLSFHPELIPANFVVAAASGRQGVPFSVLVEVLIMELAMEILREATVRMPQQVGGALSIVGVLVVGQAAVQAGFVSPITVVIIALSTIGSFAIPSYNAANAFRMLRFLLIILAGTLGLLGLAVGYMLVTNHMVTLRSFGVPYMAPFSPGNVKALKDSIIRAPLEWLKERPASVHPKDAQRVGGRVKDTADRNFLNEEGGVKDET